MTLKLPLLCVVSPCFNEVDAIAEFYHQLKSVLTELPNVRHRIVFVDDGSADDTLEQLNQIAAEDPCVRVYSLSRNFGHQVAVSAGLDVARGDAVVMMDSDCQHPPILIRRMVELWQAGYDVVSAVRKTSVDVSRVRRFYGDTFYWLINQFSDTPVVAGVADFCLLSRKAHGALRAMPEKHRFLRGMVSWIGFRRAFVEYEAPSRVAGTSKYTLGRLIGLAMDAAFSFSGTPIKVASRLGILTFLAGIAYLGYIMVWLLAAGESPPGWASLISVVLILNGLQLMFVGLSGQYQARIYEQVKARPLYFFKQAPTARTRAARKRARLADKTWPVQS